MNFPIALCYEIYLYKEGNLCYTKLIQGCRKGRKMSNRVNLNKRKKETESVLTTCCRVLRKGLDYIVCLYMLLIIVVMPFYFQEGYAHIGTDKHTFFRYCSLNIGKFMIPIFAIYCLCVMLRYVTEKRQKPKVSLSVTDIFALLYGICVIVSYGFSDYKEVALWGATGWYMGLIPQLIFLATYFAISRLWRKRNWMFLLFFPVSAIVFLLGCVNRFGIYPIDMKIENPQFISTIGNINWYCAYLVIVFFMGFFLLWQNAGEKIEGSRLRGKILLILYVAIGFATLVTQGSTSGIVALAMIFMITFVLSAKNEWKMRAFWQEVLLFAIICLLLCVIRIAFPDRMNYTDGIFDLFTKSILPLGIMLLAILFLSVLSYTKKQGNYPINIFRVLAVSLMAVVATGILTLVVMIALNTLYPGSLGAWSEKEILTFSNTWGSNRGATWRVGAMCFAEQDWLHKLFGVGPDCMESGIAQSGNDLIKGIIKEVFGSLRLTNAHNE